MDTTETSASSANESAGCETGGWLVATVTEDVPTPEIRAIDPEDPDASGRAVGGSLVPHANTMVENAAQTPSDRPARTDPTVI